MKYKAPYERLKTHILGDASICLANRHVIRQFLDFEEYKLKRRNGLQAVFSCRQHFHPVSYEELLNIANIWVSAALRLEEKDLKLMSRLARSQSKRVPGGAAAMPEEAAATVEERQYATA